MRRYSVLLEHDLEDGGFVVSVPSLPGCFTQGDSVDEAIEHAHETIQCHIEGLAATGEQIPNEELPPILITIDIDDFTAVGLGVSAEAVAP